MNIIWNGKKDKIMRKFLVITRKDLIYIQGKEDEMFEKLRSKLGKTDEEILRIIIESWLSLKKYITNFLSGIPDRMDLIKP